MTDLLNLFPSAVAMICMCVIVFLAAIVQASLGMGYGLAAAPLLALVDPIFVPVATIMIGMVSSTIGAAGERSQIIWRDVFLAVTGRLAGSVIAVIIFVQIVDKNGISILFGSAVGVAVVLSAFGRSLKKTTNSLISMGVISGLMGTITGVGAPPFALVYHGSYAGQARPTLAAIFALGCGCSLIMLMAIERVGVTDLALAGSMLPPMLLGTAAGQKIKGRFDHRYRIALLTLSGTAAVLLIVKGITGNA